AGLAVVGVILAALWVGRPLPDGEHLIRIADYQVAHDYYYRPRLAEARRKRNHKKLAALLQQYVATEPPELRSLDASSPPRDRYEELLAQHFASVRRWYAEAL